MLVWAGVVVRKCNSALLLGMVAAVAATALVTAAPAHASVLPPITEVPPITSTTPSGVQCFTSSFAPPCFRPPSVPGDSTLNGRMWRYGVARGYQPRLNVLGVLTLGPAAFALGWQIGRTLDTEFLHISGDVGDTTDYTNGDYKANATGWTYVTSTTERSTPGWRASWRVVQISTGSVISSGESYCSGTLGAPFSSTSWPAIKTAMQGIPGQEVTVASGTCAGVTAAGLNTVYKWMTENTGVEGDPVSDGGYGAPSIYSPGGGEGLEPDVGPEPYVSQPTTVTTSHPITSGRITAPTTLEADADQAAIQTSPSGDVDPLENAFNCTHDPTNFACPDAYDPDGDPGGGIDYFTIPACVGLYTYDGCVAALAAAGYIGTITRVDRTDCSTPSNCTDVAPNQVAQLSPSAGGSMPTTGAITITVNVAEEDYPYAMPMPLSLETFAEYTARLWTIYPWLGPGYAWSPVMTEEPVPDIEDPLYVPEKGPSEIIEITPAPGPELPSTEQPEYTFRTNPVDAPPPAPSGSTGGTCDPPIEANVDMSPLLNLTLSDRFPFGVVAYLATALGDLSASPIAPVFSFAFAIEAVPGGYGGSGDMDYVVDLAILDPYMTIIRSIIAVVLWIGGLWFLGASLLGFRAAGDIGDGYEEAFDDR